MPALTRESLGAERWDHAWRLDTGCEPRLGVPIDALEVEVQADYDSRGELGIADDVSPGYVQVRYRVMVTSPAPEPDVQRVLDIADKYSPYRDVYARPQDVRRETTIIARP